MKYLQTKEGFTLVEIIVSLAIFSVVAVVALGALMKIMTANKKAQSLQASISNINFALESISRQMRVGMNYNCTTSYSGGVLTVSNDGVTPQSCTFQSPGSIEGTGPIIIFNSSKAGTAPGVTCKLAIGYWFPKKGAGFEVKKLEQINCNDSLDSNISQVLPVAENMQLTDYRLAVDYDSTFMPYPRAFIRLSGYAGIKEKEKTFFDVQTAVSARLTE